MARANKIAIIDAHALIHRAYHALPPMSTRRGLPTNAAYGFTVMLLKMFTLVKPTHVVAAFDVKGKTFRSEEFADYKAHRPKAADDLVQQFDVVRRIVRAFRIPVLEHTGFEADDVIGTVVRRLDAKIKKVIITGDMDTLQLVSPVVSVLTLKRGVGDTMLFDEAAVKERYGFAPTFVPDYKGLAGDPSDNIPGVPGVGAKTAKELVIGWGTVEAMYEKLEELPAKLRKKLEGHKDEAYLSKKLAIIRDDVPIQFTLTDALLADFDPKEVQHIFEELEFRSLLQRIPKAAKKPATLFDQEVKADVPLPAHYHIAQTARDMEKLQSSLTRAKLCTFDTENERLGARSHPIVGMSFAFRTPKGELEAWYVPVNRKSVMAWKELLENSKIKKIGHNLKYDMEVLRQSGIVMQGIHFDSMIGSYLLHAGARQHSLDALAAQELAYHTIPITDLIGTGKEQKKMSQVPLAQIAHYAAEDAEVTYKLYEVFAPKIKEQKLTRVLEEIELPLLPVLVDIELAGVGLDVAVLRRLSRKVVKRIEELTHEIWKRAGTQFNISSTQQLRKILYEKLQLPTMNIARTQSGYSTAASELAKLVGMHPIIELLEEYRELTKLHSTYIATLPELVDKATGRIYASFNQTVAATGRLSSSDPNLQNIPIRTSLGQEIRAAFVADKGNMLIKADYSQLELRLAAHIAQDEKMIEAFRLGKDIHRATAAWVHGIEESKVTDAMRRQAKALNFGVMYGMGANRFAREAGISLEEARSFIGRYKEQYAGLTRLYEATITQAETEGYVETLFGRRRYLPEIRSRAPGIRAQAERIAFNFPIQGTEADILKKAMIHLHEQLLRRYPEAHLVLTVHDELVVEAPKDQVEELAPLIKKTMEGVYALDVPLVVEVEAGQNWRDVEAV